MESDRRRDARVVLDAIRRIVRLLRESTRISERTAGISSAQLFVLRTLVGSPPLSINDVAERTLTHQSSVSTVVSKLVERGLVSKQRSPDDARRMNLTLTSKGRTVAMRAPDTAQQRLIGGIDALSAKRRRNLAVGLKALIDAMGLAGEPPVMFFEDALETKQAARSTRMAAR
jgi:MarR family transcriptional regulator, lower aerobic nicotinate degradation pathway regulator